MRPGGPPDTPRRWLPDEGLWQIRRRREQHRSRRTRRACFGEPVRMDTSIHDWTEGRGEDVVLIHRIDDATGRLLARLYDADTVVDHFDPLRRWLPAHGRPLVPYTDRHDIFEAHDEGRTVPDAQTQFGRALRELTNELILARSPQAKGRVERSFQAAQDRVVEERRLPEVETIVQVNALLDGGLLEGHDRMFSVLAGDAGDAGDAHRAVGTGFDVAAILSLQEARVEANDCTVRFENRIYQLGEPVYPGQRGGRVVIEVRLDGSMVARFGEHDLKNYEIAARTAPLVGFAPDPPKFSAWGPTLAGKEKRPASTKEAGPSSVRPHRRALGSHVCGAPSYRRRGREQ